MAGLKCTCGNGMSNSNDPNDYIIRVYKKSDVENVVKDDPKIRLIDFDTLDWDFEYWYCPECGRVHKVENIPCGKVVKSFAKSTDNSTTKTKDSTWQEYYVFSDVEMYDAEEDNTTLADFITELGKSHLYLVDESKYEVYKENDRGEYELVYSEEKTH